MENRYKGETCAAFLSEWKRDTDGNRHKAVRGKIAKWAAANAPHPYYAKLFKSLGAEIVGIYEKGEREGSLGWEDHGRACVLTNVMLDAIGRVYDLDSKGLIEGCL